MIFILETGVFIGGRFLFKASGNIHSWTPSGPNPYREDSEISMEYNFFTVGGIVAMGIDIPIDKYSLIVKTTYNYGFIPISKYSGPNYYGRIFESYLELGVSFAWPTRC